SGDGVGCSISCFRPGGSVGSSFGWSTRALDTSGEPAGAASTIPPDRSVALGAMGRLLRGASRSPRKQDLPAPRHVRRLELHDRCRPSRPHTARSGARPPCPLPRPPRPYTRRLMAVSRPWRPAPAGRVRSSAEGGSAASPDSGRRLHRYVPLYFDAARSRPRSAPPTAGFDFMLSEIRLRSRSTDRTVTFTFCPTFTTVFGSRTYRSASWEMWTSPSWCTPMSTNAPKATTFVTTPSKTI